ncbi:MAG: homocysteine S-methyltransferase family protein [Acidimicrobiaceae bacterium]|jgi:S-methylmethionine-dependent homocysteine/selenocysteine methylase|nr:homocysteine S-methyltransferase family protein [Acidimicrobiaceae bacterium]MBT5582071.1 homocysteine S-methyltransferase family protein [Acidimicrobiaceae bacterium]MBT5850952.1 homocysteine S-methyltransferase family protein [Acidimicrobiaceae bacterium]
MTFTLLDGGMGKALEEAGAPFRQPEWSALSLLDDPSWVRRVHDDFIGAGADVIITNNYAVVPFHLGEDRFVSRGAELTALSGRLAREAADAATGDVLVAGSIPPLFGSYQPELFDAERAPVMLATIAKELAPFVDFFVAETQSSLSEVMASAAAVQHFGKPLWLSATLLDEPAPPAATLRSGESIEAFCEAVVESDASAVLFNCSHPEVMEDAIRRARTALPNTVEVGAYANAFEPKPEVYSANEVIMTHRADLDDGGYDAFVQSWLDAGATIVGGCCGIMPRHIARLAALR